MLILMWLLAQITKALRGTNPASNDTPPQSIEFRPTSPPLTTAPQADEPRMRDYRAFPSVDFERWENQMSLKDGPDD